MLPDLRVLLIATASTFLVAICAALFVSVHVLPERLNTVQPERAPPVLSAGWHDASRPAPDLSPMPRRADIPLPQPKAETGVGESVAIKTSAPTDTVPAPADTARTPDKDTPSKEGDAPISTGSIGETASASAPEQQEPVARQEPAETPQAIADPKTQPLAPAAMPKPAARPAKKHRVVKRDSFGFPQNPPSTLDPNYNFFIDFGSHMR
jgi:hypothetical protein